MAAEISVDLGYDVIALAVAVVYVALRLAERLVTAFFRRRKG